MRAESASIREPSPSIREPSPSSREPSPSSRAEIEERPERRRGEKADRGPDGGVHLARERSTRLRRGGSRMSRRGPIPKSVSDRSRDRSLDGADRASTRCPNSQVPLGQAERRIMPRGKHAPTRRSELGEGSAGRSDQDVPDRRRPRLHALHPGARRRGRREARGEVRRHRARGHRGARWHAPRAPRGRGPLRLLIDPGGDPCRGRSPAAVR